MLLYFKNLQKNQLQPNEFIYINDSNSSNQELINKIKKTYNSERVYISGAKVDLSVLSASNSQSVNIQLNTQNKDSIKFTVDSLLNTGKKYNITKGWVTKSLIESLGLSQSEIDTVFSENPKNGRFFFNAVDLPALKILLDSIPVLSADKKEKLTKEFMVSEYFEIKSGECVNVIESSSGFLNKLCLTFNQDEYGKKVKYEFTDLKELR